jgi:C-terminal processing protease CtpA/Prc
MQEVCCKHVTFPRQLKFDLFKGYGFNLSRIADVHFIRVVEDGSAADKAGLQVPDQILKVC